MFCFLYLTEVVMAVNLRALISDSEGSTADGGEESGGELPCPVDACLHYGRSTLALMRHWVQTHELASRNFLCPLRQHTGCDYSSSRTFNLKRHTTNIHHDIHDKNANKIAKLCQRSSLECGEVLNVVYVPPGDARPMMDVALYYEKVGLSNLVQPIAQDTMSNVRRVVQSPQTPQVQASTSAEGRAPSAESASSTPQKEAMQITITQAVEDTGPSSSATAEAQSGNAAGETQPPITRDYVIVDGVAVASVEETTGATQSVLARNISARSPLAIEVRPFGTAEAAWSQMQLWKSIYEQLSLTERQAQATPQAPGNNWMEQSLKSMADELNRMKHQNAELRQENSRLKRELEEAPDMDLSA